MICTFLRSSSYTCFDLCQHKFFLSYVLGMKEVAGIAADKGNTTHKALELLAKYKLAIQKHEPVFVDDETGSFNTLDFSPQHAIEIAWNHVRKCAPYHNWTQSDFNDCEKWMYEALNWRNGMFSPLKREIVEAEKKFDFIIKEPWAAYDYVLPTGEKETGYLALKGTIDLLVKEGNNMEMIDWKTGKSRIDWANFQQKTYEKLMLDPQLRLYHYAASRLFPKIENIFITIFYLQAGGPESLCFTKDDLKLTEEMVKNRFNAIRNTVRPKKVYPSKKCNFCHFSKVTIDGSPAEGYENSICNTTHNEVLTLGLDKVMKKYHSKDCHNIYGDGGGRRYKGENNGK